MRCSDNVDTTTTSFAPKVWHRRGRHIGGNGCSPPTAAWCSEKRKV